MIAPLASDQAHPPCVTARAVVGEGDLERGVGAFRPRVGEEHPVEPVGEEVGEPRRSLEGEGVAYLEGGREIHHRRLPLDRLRHLAPAVPGVDAPKSRGRVDHVPPVRRVVCMPSARASRRGCDLKARFAVNGIQKASRLLGGGRVVSLIRRSARIERTLAL